MLKRSLSVLLSLVSFALSGVVLAQSAADLVMVKDPHVRAVPPGLLNSACFMILYNGDSRDHALVGAQTPVAKVVELHIHTMAEGMMQMRQLDKVDLPAGKDVSLHPGGMHVMLIGLKQKLVPGEPIPLTLVFADGSKKMLSVPVRKLQMHMKMK